MDSQRTLGAQMVFVGQPYAVVVRRGAKRRSVQAQGGRRGLTCWGACNRAAESCVDRRGGVGSGRALRDSVFQDPLTEKALTMAGSCARLACEMNLIGSPYQIRHSSTERLFEHRSKAPIRGASAPTFRHAAPAHAAARSAVFTPTRVRTRCRNLANCVVVGPARARRRAGPSRRRNHISRNGSLDSRDKSCLLPLVCFSTI